MGGRRTLAIAYVIVRALWVLNIVAAIVFAGAIVASIPFAGALAAHLHHRYGAGIDAAQVVLAMRLLLACGVLAAVPLHVIFTALLRILATVRIGDPFTLANAQRLQRIGWALLVIQLLDLGMGGFTAWFAMLHVRAASWSPDIGGWIAVLMVFVLAGVFARGAAMRDDLAMTI